MKINKILFLTIILFFSLLIPNVVNGAVGEGFTYNNIKYIVLTEESNNYTVKVSGYEGNAAEVNIPQTVANNTNTYTVTEIGENAFRDCKSLINIIIPNSVKVIKKLAFSYAELLENVTLSNSLTTIENGAFQDCTSLTKIAIPASVTSIGNGVFAWCPKLEGISVTSGNTEYCADEGILFNYDKTKLICYPASKEGTSYIIPNSVVSIESFAFKCCSNLKSIEIPNSVTTIKSSAFDECKALTSITIPNSITTIEPYTFVWCHNLNRINMPDSITTIIDDSAFWGCDYLTFFCNDASYAKQYAQNNNINSKPLYYYSVINELVNLKSNGKFYAHPEEGDYTTTLTPIEEHVLPQNIKVKIGNDTIEYNYNSTTGKLVIPAANITGDITIEATVYKVVFDANGGTFASNDEETLVFDDWQSDDYINLEKPTREGYEFLGYYTEITDGTSFDMYYNEAGVDQDMEIYAKWKIINPFMQNSINQTFAIGKDKTLSFTMSIEDIAKENRTVYVDGEKLSMENGDFTSQNVDSYPYITLTENYMKTLKTGTHTIKIVLKDGTEVETTFKVIELAAGGTEETMPQPDGEDAGNIAPTSTTTPANKPTSNNPQTGDNIVVFIGLFVISLIGILYIRKYKK